jgi:SAM-dependent methyltransferase
MQERYLPRRQERFELMVELLRVTQVEPAVVVDLGCGTGSLLQRCLTAFPTAELYGIDLDPTLLPLAGARTSADSHRVHLEQVDLRDPSWVDSLPARVDACVTATALHWLSAGELSAIYDQVARRLAPGGILLNADHAASDVPSIQRHWEKRRDTWLQEHLDPSSDDWSTFWDGYLALWGKEARAARVVALGPWTGVEQGLPLTWHFAALRQAGFAVADCYWRSDCDAIYGGIKG